MSVVFISYSSKDSPFVLHLAEDLREAGFTIWLDKWNIVGQRPYWAEIQSGIETCSHMLFVISPDSIANDSGAMDELYHASSLTPDRVIVPVLAREMSFDSLPILISPGKLQIHDFVNAPYREALARVIRALQSDVSLRPSATAQIMTTPLTIRNSKISGLPSGSLLAGAVVLLIVGLLIGRISAQIFSDSRILTGTIALNATNTSLALAQSNVTPFSTPILTGTRTKGDVRILLSGIKLVYVPVGCFQMGSADSDPNGKDNEKRQHKICITKPFWIGQYEVTNAEYQQFVDAGGYDDSKYWSPDGWTWKANRSAPVNRNDFIGSNQPRVGITWYEAEAFAKWAGGRLPTEAEWQFAARGEKSSIYPWGDIYINGNANIDERDEGGTYLAQTSPVGTYPIDKSWVSAYDMAGNVWEWCADWYASDYYSGSPQDNPIGPINGDYRVVAGGTWHSGTITARSANRGYFDPRLETTYNGMRIVVPVTN